LLRTLGFDRAVLVNASCHGLDNRPVLDAIAASGGRNRGVANIDDRLSADELRALHDGRIRGCRFNFVRHLGGVPAEVKTLGDSSAWTRSPYRA
jgi:hypothetical protein